MAEPDDPRAQVRRDFDAVPLDAIDVSVPAYFADETAARMFARLRRDDPVRFCTHSAYGPYWSITRHADLIEIEKDYRRFSSAGNVIINDVPPQFDAPAFATADPPEHTHERAAVAPALGTHRVAALENGIRREIAAILDGLPVGEPFDWVERVSIELTTRMAAALFDFPQTERKLLSYWADVLVTAPEPGALIESWEERAAVLDVYLGRVMEMWRKRRGGGCSDIISALANAPATQCMPDDPKHLIGTITMIAGANEATRGALTGGVVAFDRFPHSWERLRAEPSLIPNAVAEIVRWQSPIAHMRRTATQDVVFRGKTIRKGDRVVLWYCSANRDEAIFEDGDTFHADRMNARDHVGFGSGIHRCLGRHVAYAELRLLWEEVIRRFSHIRVCEPPERLASNFSANYRRLVVRLER
ncbi:Linalool 8-monooxygenase [Paraburkholderia domus]|jgi:Cytochrome P450|nr:Linalool 8-monooxygenase [Paraburkholderia domus]